MARESALEELNAALKAAGGLVFNAHAITVEDGGLGVIDADEWLQNGLMTPLGSAIQANCGAGIRGSRA